MTIKKTISLFLIAVASYLHSKCDAQTSIQDSVKYSRQLIRIEQQLMDAIAVGDTAIWKKYLDKKFFNVIEDGTRLDVEPFIGSFSPLPPGYIGHINVIKPKLLFFDNAAVISYVADEYLILHGQKIHTTYGSINTYRKTDTSWMKMASQVFEIPQLPPSIKVSAAMLKKYTGTYQLTDTISCTVILQNDTLFIQKKGRVKEILLPETESVFFRKSDTRGRKIFFKNEKGLMLMYERRNGEDVIWNRVK